MGSQQRDLRLKSTRSARALGLALTATLLAGALPGCAAWRTPAIVARTAWDRFPAPPYALPEQHPRRIVIHHDAVDYRPEQTGEEKMRLLLRGSQEREGWPDVPYHYLIDRDGRIFAGLPEQYPGDTHTEYDPSDAIHVALLGNYSKLEPTPAQLDALARLVRAKARQYGIPAAEIKLHAGLTTTECPGTNLRHRLAGVTW